MERVSGVKVCHEFPKNSFRSSTTVHLDASQMERGLVGSCGSLAARKNTQLQETFSSFIMSHAPSLTQLPNTQGRAVEKRWHSFPPPSRGFGSSPLEYLAGSSDREGSNVNKQRQSISVKTPLLIMLHIWATVSYVSNFTLIGKTILPFLKAN